MKKRENMFLFIVLIILILCNCGCIIKEQTRPVDDNVLIEGKGNFPSIQSAIDNASNGDIIYIKNDTYQETLIINKSVSLIGEGAYTIIKYNCSNSPQIQIIKVMADNVTINGFTITESSLSNEFIGIDVYSSGNIVSNNTIRNCKDGIYLYENSKGNNIKDNIIINNKDGMYTRFSTNNNIFNNNFSYNKNYGIYFRYKSNNNKIFDNFFSNNQYGIRIKSSEYNLVTENIFSNNDRGIYLCCGARNNILFNNILKNNKIYNSKSTIDNQWDNDSIGNYWDDYNGTDANEDGIGDKPYIIDEIHNALGVEYIADNFPLMEEPFSIL